MKIIGAVKQSNIKLNVFRVLDVFKMPKDPSLAYWALFFKRMY